MQAASAVAGTAARAIARQPEVVGRPARSIRSFTATVVPALPRWVESMKVASAAFAI